MLARLLDLPPNRNKFRQGTLDQLRRYFASSSTPHVTPQSALVIAPHPDDETIGCGGLIIKKRAIGAEVRIAFVTDGGASHSSDLIDPKRLIAIRREEACEAAGRLGVGRGQLHFLGYPDGRVAQFRTELVADILTLLKRHEPHTVVIPHAKEPPPDHHRTSAYVLEAVAMWGRQICICEYPVWYWQHWPWVPLTPSLRAGSRRKWSQSLYRGFGLASLIDFNYRLNIEDVLPRKRHALHAHASQITGLAGRSHWPTLSELENGLVLESMLQSIESYRLTINKRCESEPLR